VAKIRKKVDRRLRAVADALAKYEAQHPNAQAEIYRQNSASIRIRVVDPDFAGSSKADRHDTVWTFLEGLPEAVLAEISMLLLLTPDELETSFANYDFEHPIPSRL
jgi:stress-induced morphogen